jgi:flagellin
MALGVLNNISAISAQNNLANTQASLSKTLQQLSSGSRINSGADDAAGLSLANGLQASSTALTQSAKNASEGVDFLQVADGALSQVTSLLNRAVTLATEAGNGTLNSSQTSAANSEYQKILGEVDTINSNTEYNGIQTFAQNAAYTVGSSSDTVQIGGSAAVTNLLQVDYADGTSQKIGNSTTTSATNTNLKANATLADLAKAINAGSGSSVASVVNNQLVLTGGAKIDATGTPSLSSTNTVAAGSTALQVGSASNALSGVSGLSVSYNGVSTALQADTSLQVVMNDINNNVHAGLASISGNTLVLAGASISGTFSETQAAAGTGTNTSVAIFTSDGTLNKSYNNSSTDVIKTDSNALSLAGTMLDATHAQGALSLINSAITTVAAARGTIGANINTLTAVENVMTMQSTNTLAAENDVTATDYGQATSDMSKFQILSQTGIAALSQANQSQQLITKLLQ